MSTARVGALAGWLTFIGVLAFEVVMPMVTAGPRVTGSTDRAVIEAYYAHGSLAWSGLGIMAVVVAITLVTDARSYIVLSAVTAAPDPAHVSRP